MAFDCECRECGHKEAEHGDKSYPNACRTYQSPCREWEDEQWELDAEPPPGSDLEGKYWILPSGAVIDIGS